MYSIETMKELVELIETGKEEEAQEIKRECAIEALGDYARWFKEDDYDDLAPYDKEDIFYQILRMMKIYFDVITAEDVKSMRSYFNAKFFSNLW